ncbi:hypothetical protein GCM10023083_45560 [Streptomyces phyllanthi]
MRRTLYPVRARPSAPRAPRQRHTVRDGKNLPVTLTAVGPTRTGTPFRWDRDTTSPVPPCSHAGSGGTPLPPRPKG